MSGLLLCRAGVVGAKNAPRTEAVEGQAETAHESVIQQNRS